MKYEHSLALNFEIKTNSENPSAEELLKALQEKVASLNLENVAENIEIFNSEEL